jgi:hypothetical protein
VACLQERAVLIVLAEKETGETVHFSLLRKQTETVKSFPVFQGFSVLE